MSMHSKQVGQALDVRIYTALVRAVFTVNVSRVAT